MKSLTRLDLSISERPWARAPPLISIAPPPGKLQSRQVNPPEKIPRDHAPGIRSSALKIGPIESAEHALHGRVALIARGRQITAVFSSN
jgi:hypothetical protein